MNLREFKPTIFFLIRFVLIYLVGNITYGFYISKFLPKADPATHSISVLSTDILALCGEPVRYWAHAEHPATSIVKNDKPVLSVYEGCNGVNTLIVFASFLLALGPYGRSMAWFLPLGLGTIYLANVGRILVLYAVALYQPHALYFIHKYLLTAVLFGIIFLLWIWWVKKIAIKKPT